MGTFIDQTLATFEAMAIAIADLRQRIEALEKQGSEKQFIHLKSPVFTMPKRTLDETDRSHDVVIGARVDSSHTGV